MWHLCLELSCLYTILHVWIISPYAYGPTSSNKHIAPRIDIILYILIHVLLRLFNLDCSIPASLVTDSRPER